MKVQALLIRTEIKKGSATYIAHITNETDKAIEITCYKDRRGYKRQESDWYPKSDIVMNDYRVELADWMVGSKNYFAALLV